MQTSSASSSRFLNLPIEIADRIYTYCLCSDPSTTVPLLLTSRITNSLVAYRADQLVRKVVSSKPRLHLFFEPRPDKNLWESWIPRLKAIEERLAMIGDFAQAHVRRSALSVVEGDWSTYDFCRAFRMGLTLVEMLHCAGRQEPIAMDGYLEALPIEALTLIRFVSTTVMDMLDCEYVLELEAQGLGEDEHITPESVFRDFAEALEVRLLTRGCESVADMFRPVVSGFVLEKLQGTELETLRDYNLLAQSRQRKEKETLQKEAGRLRRIERNSAAQVSVYEGMSSHLDVNERLRGYYGDEALEHPEPTWQIAFFVEVFKIDIGDKEDADVLMKWKYEAGIR